MDAMGRNAQSATDFLKAIAHEGRLMILCRLANGECSVTSHSMCVLLRRLGDTDFRGSDEYSADEIWDAATSLQSSILMVLGIDDDGTYIGREAMGLE